MKLLCVSLKKPGSSRSLSLVSFCSHCRIITEEMIIWNANPFTPQPLCLWRVVRAERASSQCTVLMAHLKSFNSSIKCCMTILNDRHLFPQVCFSVMNVLNLILMRKHRLHSWDKVNGSDTAQLFNWMLNIGGVVQNTHVNNPSHFSTFMVFLMSGRSFLSLKSYWSVCFTKLLKSDRLKWPYFRIHLYIKCENRIPSILLDNDPDMHTTLP